MLKKVREFAEKWHMFESGDRIIAGVSGGADSICLLFVLLELQKEIPFEIIVVHVNHGLRGKDADADEDYVKRICQEHHLECVVYSENVELIAKNRKQSTEEAGRDVRREAFHQTMELYQGNKIALAHHKNDNVETFLMNLARGTGLKGLTGIRPVNGQIVRPLLCLERKEIETYLKQQEIYFCIDESNQGDEYTRNRIRNHMVPFLEKEINSCAVSHMNDTMEQLLEIQKYLAEQTQYFHKMCVEYREYYYLVNSTQFSSVPKAIQPLVLKQVLADAAEKEKDIESVHIKALQELFEKQTGKRIDLPYEMEALRVYEGVCIQKKREVQAEGFCMEIELKKFEKQEIFWKKQRVTCQIVEKIPINCKEMQKNNTKYFDYDIIKDKLCIRTRRPGDYITIHPDGRTQKLKSYFINEKIPKEKRDEILLAADGNHIIWVIGFRANCIYQAGRNTKHILEIQMDKGESHGRNN